MNLFSKLSQTKVAKISAFAMILALAVSFVGYSMAATSGTGAHTVVVRVFEGDPINNKRVSGANVLMVADDRSSPSHGLRADTDSNGTVTFTSVDEGGFNIEIRKNGYNGQDYHVLVNESMQIDGTLISLTTGPANPTPTPPGAECTPTPPRGQPLLNIWPIAETGADCTDYSLLAAKNVTQNGGYAHSVSATTGDTIQVRLYVHNGVLDYDDNVAHNVMVKASLPAASGTMTAEAWADNATKINSSQKGGDVGVTLGSNQHLEFIPGSVLVYGRGPVLIGGGSDAVVGSGMSVGDMRGCYPYLRFVTFKVQVKANAVTPPPAPQPTPPPAPQPTPPPAPQPTPPPPAPGSINIDKTVRNVTQNGSTFVSEVGANPGDQVEFQIVLTAHNTVNNIVANDTLPSQLTYVNNSLRIDGADGGNNLSAINLGTRTNSAVKITLRATVAGASSFGVGRNEMVNTASFTSSAGSGSDHAKVVVQITPVTPPPAPQPTPPPAPMPSLLVDKQVRNITNSESAFRDITNASANQTVEFRIEVKNTSSTNAVNVKLADALPAQLTFVTNSFRMDGASEGVDSFFTTGFSVGTLTPGQSRVFTFLENTAATITANATVVNTATASATNVNPISDSATVILNPVLGTSVDLRLSKKAYNFTQSVDATTTTAKLGDVIQYILTVENKGTATSQGFVIQDNISDVLQLSDLADYTGATLDSSNTLKWAAMDIAPGAKVEKIFTVRIKSTIPAGTDYTMTNVYGNTVNVSVLKFVAPPTGSTTTISLILGFVVAAGAVAFRKYRFVLSPKFLQSR